ncbi:hypothetical protein [Oryzobacter telluris]|uniref:hypothetical protein n=1 Tax=Oryzobacter telluris TaxID=3149179 RepID=UPI00370D57EA
MTTTAEDDLRAFVVARWPELEAVARVVVLDPAVARRVTTDTLAGLSARWREAVEDGRPAEGARRDLLAAAVAAAGTVKSAARPAHPTTPRPPGSPVPQQISWDVDLPDHSGADVPAHLAAAITKLDPLDRALLAARVVWDATTWEAADLLSLPPDDVEARVTRLDARLAALHDEARAADGAEPAPWALERDLADAVALLLRGQHDPPDPAALVADRAGGLRRRRFLLGGVAAAGLAGVGWWVLGPAATGQHRTTALPAPEDPVWDTTTRWPARGALAADPDAQALVIRDAPPGSRLLYADDVGDTRVVVASPADLSGGGSVRVVLWTGPLGAPTASLTAVPLARDALPGARDVVALVIAQTVGDALLVLGGPALREAMYSAVVQATPDGVVSHDFTRMGLTDGIGVELVGRGLGPATQVVAGRFQGTPAGTPGPPGSILPSLAPADYARDRRELVAALTGVPGGLLSSRVVLDSPAPDRALDVDGTAGGRGSARAVVVHTRTPDDAIIRSVRIIDERPGRQGSYDAEQAAVVDATRADEPVFVTLPTGSTTQRFLVAAPGAGRARLLSQGTGHRPVTRFVECTGETVVLTVPDARQESTYWLELQDDGGRPLFRGLPLDANELV